MDTPVKRAEKGKVVLLENLADCISKRAIMSASHWAISVSLSLKAFSAA
jgi:hypothetical protein